MDPEAAIIIMQMILCPNLDYLKKKAKDSDNKFDDAGVKILNLLLCQQGE